MRWEFRYIVEIDAQLPTCPYTMHQNRLQALSPNQSSQQTMLENHTRAHMSNPMICYLAHLRFISCVSSRSLDSRFILRAHLSLPTPKRRLESCSRESFPTIMCHSNTPNHADRYSRQGLPASPPFYDFPFFFTVRNLMQNYSKW